MNETTFVRSPFFDNWFSHFKPQKSILICSPYIKSYALDRVFNICNMFDTYDAFQVEVLMRGRLEDFIQGSSDIAALEYLIQLKNLDLDKVRRLTNLHMKAYLIDNSNLLIGSGNCTNRGLFTERDNANIEGAVSTDSKPIIEQFSEYYNEINKSSESLDTFYDKIVTEYDAHIDEYAPLISKEMSALMSQGESKAEYKFKKEGKKRAVVSLEITPDLIPQFSNFDDGTYKLIQILTNEGNRGLTFNELGEKLEGPGRSDVAYKKYGENHAKLGELLDLTTINNESPRKVFLTKLGESFFKSNDSRKTAILKSQIVRMDIIRDIFQNSQDKDFDLTSYLGSYLAETTAERRRPNVKRLISFLAENEVVAAKDVLKKL